MAPLLGVAALQLETREGLGREEQLAHIDALLDGECHRLGVRRWDDAGSAKDCSGNSCDCSDSGSTSGGSSSSSVHLDILVLPEIFNTPYRLDEAAWHSAKGLQLEKQHPVHSPSLASLSRWAVRYRCYAVGTLLEASPDGHIYNSLVMAAPDGRFVTAAGSASAGGSGSSNDGPSSSGTTGSGSGGSCGGGTAALVRKHRAASLEGFVFRSAGQAGRGGEPAAHVVEVDAAPLLAKWSGGVEAEVGAGGGGGSSCTCTCTGAGAAEPQRLRLAFAICYENLCLPPMQAILEAHCREPIDLLISPFCAMLSNPDHPTFKWPHAAAERFAELARGATRLHAAKLRTHAVAAQHTGPWASPLPRLLPFLPRCAVPLEGPMLGCSAVYAPGGAELAALGPDGEGLALAQLPLLQRPRPRVAEHAPQQPPAISLSSQLEAALGATAVASAAAGPATPYARFPGGCVVPPVSWEMWLGFPLMEILGSFSYHVLRAPLRRRVAQAIAADGVWTGSGAPAQISNQSSDGGGRKG